MCTDAVSPKRSKVSRGYVLVTPRSTTTVDRGAESVLAEVKRLVKYVISRSVHGLRRGSGRGGKFDPREAPAPGYEIVVETENERDNAANENKSSATDRASKMAYTIEELREIVDDNLANELTEIRGREIDSR